MKKCPYCAEEIQDEAIKCKHCGEMLNEAGYKKDKNTLNFSQNFIKRESSRNLIIGASVIIFLMLVYATLAMLGIGDYSSVNITGDLSLWGSVVLGILIILLVSYRKKNKKESTENKEGLREKQRHNAEVNSIKNEEKYIKCPHCTKMMSIDATTCPHCGKTGGFSYNYMIAGMITGLIGSVLFFYITTGGEDFFSSAMCGMCICNPIFWAFAISGAIIGWIAGEIKKNKIKQQK